MSDSAQTRRSFIKGSMAKSLIAANAGVVVGLINTPGIAGATTTGPGTTQPATTQATVIPWVQFTATSITYESEPVNGNTNGGPPSSWTIPDLIIEAQKKSSTASTGYQQTAAGDPVTKPNPYPQEGYPKFIEIDSGSITPTWVDVGGGKYKLRVTYSGGVSGTKIFVAGANPPPPA